MIDVGKTNDVDDVTNLQITRLTRPHLQSARRILQKQIFARPLQRNDAFQMHALAWLNVPAIFSNAA